MGECFHRVEFGTGLDDPGGDQTSEHRIVVRGLVEAELAVRIVEGIDEVDGFFTGYRHGGLLCAGAGRGSVHTQIQAHLVPVNQALGLQP